MSQDLFAEFGSPEPPTSSQYGGLSHSPSYPDARLQGNPARPATSLAAHAEIQGSNGVDEDDDFGDFEDASSAVQPSAKALMEATPDPGIKPTLPVAPQRPTKTYPPPKQTLVANQVPASEPPTAPTETGRHPFADHMDMLFGADDDEYDAGADEMADLATNPEAAMAYSKRVIASQQPAGGPSGPTASPKVRPSPKREPNKLRKKSGYVPSRGAEVLFDAEDPPDNTDDDFGGFEAAKEKPPQKKAVFAPTPEIPAVDLLTLNEQQVTPRSDPSAVVNDFEDDAWDDFESASTPIIDRASPPTSTATGESAFQRSTAAIGSKPTASTSTELPPTSVPASSCPALHLPVNVRFRRRSTPDAALQARHEGKADAARTSCHSSVPTWVPWVCSRPWTHYCRSQTPLEARSTSSTEHAHRPSRRGRQKRHEARRHRQV